MFGSSDRNFYQEWSDKKRGNIFTHQVDADTIPLHVPRRLLVRCTRFRKFFRRCAGFYLLLRYSNMPLLYLNTHSCRIDHLTIKGLDSFTSFLLMNCGVVDEVIKYTSINDNNFKRMPEV